MADRAVHCAERTFAATPSEQGTARSGRVRFPSGTWMLVGTMLLTAFTLRLYRIGEQELWFDEGFSYLLAARSDWWSLAWIDSPLYYMILHAWFPLLGQSTGAFRLASAVFGTAFVAVIIWAGRELFDAHVGLWAGALASIAPMHIYYSQEARNYTLLTLEVTLTYTLLWRALLHNTWTRWVLAGVPALATLYTHFFGIVALAPAAIIIVLWSGVQKTRPPWGRVSTVALAVMLLWLPWLLWAFILKARPLGGLGWLEALWDHIPPLMAIPKSLGLLLLGPQPGLIPAGMFYKQYTEFPFPLELQFAGILSLAGLAGLGCAPWRDDRMAILRLSARKMALVAWALIPITILWAVSWVKPIYAIGRYDQLAFPALALFIGLGLSKAQRLPRCGTFLAPLLAALLLIPVSVKLVRYYATPGQLTYREFARTLDASVSDGDVVVLSFRSYSVVPYLIQRGYRCNDRTCEDRSGTKRFVYRFYPLAAELGGEIYDLGETVTSIDEALLELQDFTRSLSRPGGRMWFELGDRRGSEGGPLFLTEQQTFLYEALTRTGSVRLVVPKMGLFRYAPLRT